MPSQRGQEACSFCGKSQRQVRRLIGGPGGVFICDACVRLCNTIVTEHDDGGGGAVARSGWQAGGRRGDGWWRRFLPLRRRAGHTGVMWEGYAGR